MSNDEKNFIRNTTSEAGDPRMIGIKALTAVPGSIEAQERQGQGELVRSAVLPTDGLKRLEALYGSIGLVVGIPVAGDALFTYVELPAGWKKIATNHAMWSKLVDDKGRERAGVFYKAALYDRKAHVHATPRFRVGIDYLAEDRSVLTCTVTEGDAVLFRTAPVPNPSWNIEELAAPERQAAANKYREAQDAIEAYCNAWLDQHYPNHRDPIRSWDDVGARDA